MNNLNENKKKNKNRKHFISNPGTCSFRVDEILKFKDLFHDFLEHYPYFRMDDTVSMEDLTDFLIREKSFSVKENEFLLLLFLEFLKSLKPEIPSFSVKELDLENQKVYTLELKNN